MFSKPFWVVLFLVNAVCLVIWGLTLFEYLPTRPGSPEWLTPVGVGITVLALISTGYEAFFNKANK